MTKLSPLPDPELLHRPMNAPSAHSSAVRITARTVVQPFRYGGSGPSPSSVRCGNQDFRSLRPPSSGRRTCDPREGPGASRIVGVVGRSSLVQSGTPRRDDWDHESADRLIPLSIGAVRPTQGKTLAVMQVCGGSQSFNAVNQLRVLGRWMRMITIPISRRSPRHTNSSKKPGA